MGGRKVQGSRAQSKFLGLGVLSLIVAMASGPAGARIQRVVDSALDVSFVPPPYFQTQPVTKGGVVHFSLVPPDKSVTISTGGYKDKKLHNAPPMEPEQIKAACTTALSQLGKGFTITQSKRFLLDSQNGAECQFTDTSGRTVHWVGATVPAQMVLFMADWPKPPSKEQVTIFRQFLGGVQLF